jgi:hypothetical protein
VARVQVQPSEVEPYTSRTAPVQVQVSQQVAVPVAPEVAQPTAVEQPAVEQPLAARGPAWARAALPPLRPAATILPSTLSRGASRGLGQGSASGLPGQPGQGSAGGTFNFFTRQEGAISTHLSRRPSGDLADVVGDEAAAAQDRYAAGEEQDVYWTASAVVGTADVHGGRAAEAAAPVVVQNDAQNDAQHAAQHPQAGQQPELMDLTAEDETEPIDVRVLRAL